MNVLIERDTLSVPLFVFLTIMITLKIIQERYFEEETNDPITIAEAKRSGPLVKAPDGYWWPDGEETARIPHSGDYIVKTMQGEQEVEATLRIVLQGWGTKDRVPGQKVELTARQKYVIERVRRAKEASSKAAIQQGASDEW